MTEPTIYRCRKCGDTPEPESHHMMKSCTCGAIAVDRGWYGSKVIWKGGTYDEVVEAVPAVLDLPQAHRVSE